MSGKDRPGIVRRSRVRRARLGALTAIPLLLLMAGCAAGVQLLITPGMLAEATQPAINTPAPAPGGTWSAPGAAILPEPDLGAAGALAAALPDGSPPAVATATSPTPAGTQELALALPQPAFEIAPEVGTPGTEITVAGQGWAPEDAVALRLQDPTNPYVQPVTYLVAQADSSGNFKVNFTVPGNAPWAGLPAIMIWAVSQKTGIQAAQPEPFVVLSAPMQQAAAVPGQQAAATPSVTATPTPGTGPGQSPLPTPTADAAATAAIQAQAAASAASSAQFTSPLATPTALPTPTIAPSATALPAFQSPLPTPALARPGALPRSGGDLLHTALVQSAEAALLAGPGADYRQLAMLAAGDPVGVIGQDVSGDWLLVTTATGRAGWVRRSETDERGSPRVIRPRG